MGVGGRKREERKREERKREMVGITARGKRVGSWGKKKNKSKRNRNRASTSGFTSAAQ